jgi:hypothetical protein
MRRGPFGPPGFGPDDCGPVGGPGPPTFGPRGEFGDCGPEGGPGPFFGPFFFDRRLGTFPIGYVSGLAGSVCVVTLFLKSIFPRWCRDIPDHRKGTRDNVGRAGK